MKTLTHDITHTGTPKIHVTHCHFMQFVLDVLTRGLWITLRQISQMRLESKLHDAATQSPRCGPSLRAGETGPNQHLTPQYVTASCCVSNLFAFIVE
jgi:hypothetical protein